MKDFSCLVADTALSHKVPVIIKIQDKRGKPKGNFGWGPVSIEHYSNCYLFTEFMMEDNKITFESDDLDRVFC